MESSSISVIASRFRPQDSVSALLYDATTVLLGSFFVALLAQLAIPVPGSPVPVTGQTLGVLLVGAALGSKRGAATILVYILEGALGLPVFAQGKYGLLVLLGPTAGYIVGFVLSAFVVGWLAERGWDRSPLSTALAMVLGYAIIYGSGAMGLLRFAEPDQIWQIGILPFLPGAALKIALASALLPCCWRFLRKSNSSPEPPGA